MEKQFDFGKNWEKYLDSGFDKSRLGKAASSMKKLLKLENFSNKIFLDIGCGSGIFSLAALQLGAKQIISIDVDEKAVECCEMLKAASGNPLNWEILKGSLADKKFVSSLPKADIVYCWGVAHHTGKMWPSLDNLPFLLKRNGLLVVAIYNRMEGFFSSERWARIKRHYNRGNFLTKKTMEYFYLSYNFLRLVIRFKNPFKVIRNYKARGMAWKTDLIDWLGGYPYEYASTQEVFEFFHDKHKLQMANIKTTNYSGCNQFVFQKKVTSL